VLISETFNMTVMITAENVMITKVCDINKVRET
jgi:hypothetical protein